MSGEYGGAPRLVHLLRRIFSLSAREFGELMVAQAYLAMALWTVRRRPKGSLLRTIEARHPGDRAQQSRLAPLVAAVDRAARYGAFRPTCLVRAVALERMIARSGAGAAVVRVGVVRDREAFLAHAWIELDGKVIGDEPAHVARFTPLHDFSALAR